MLKKKRRAGKRRFRVTAYLSVIVVVCVAVVAAVIGIVAVSVRSAASGNLSNPDYIVVIDPGHGGEDGGAVGIDGVVEKNINLSISLKLKAFFAEAGYTVVMTRETDTAIYDEGCDTLREKKVSDLHNRLKIGSQYPDSVFISIHQNIFSQSKYCGTQVFYSKNNPLGKILAQKIQSNIKTVLQPQNDREIKEGQKNLYLLYNARSPAVMVECGFLSNPTECAKLQTDEYQNRLAFTIFYSTLQYQHEKTTAENIEEAARD